MLSGFEKKFDGFYFYANFGWRGSQDGFYNIDFVSDYLPEYLNYTVQTAMIGISPKKEEYDIHNIYAKCTKSVIRDYGKLSFSVSNANSYLLKIKYNEGTNVVIDDVKSGIVHSDGVIDVWYKSDAVLEREYKGVRGVEITTAMYEITFFNNYGDVKTYEGYFTDDDVEFQPTSLKSSVSHSIRSMCFPNPTSDKLFVSIGTEVIVKVEVVDVAGRILKSISVNGNNAKIELNVSDLESGMYFVNIFTDNSNLVKQVFIKR